MLRCVAHDVVPSLAFAVGALTLLVPFLLVRASHTYVGGLAWPFVADLARDFPSSVVFGVGLNALALLVAFMWVLNRRRHLRFLDSSMLDEQAVASFVRDSSICTTAGVAGVCLLPLYATATAATAPHRIAGGAFLALEALACFINSFLNYHICLAKREELETGVFVTIKFAPRSVAVEKLIALKKAKRGFLVELACSALFLMSVLVYLPILYQTAPAARLTVQQCLDRGLGDHYCSDTVRLDATQTTLWNYEADFAGYQVRAFAQLGCLLTLLTYPLSFVVSNNEPEESEQSERDRLFYTAVSRPSPVLGGQPPDHSGDIPRGRQRSRSRTSSSSKQSTGVRSPSDSPPRRGPFTPTSPSGPKSYISV